MKRGIWFIAVLVVWALLSLGFTALIEPTVNALPPVVSTLLQTALLSALAAVAVYPLVRWASAPQSVWLSLAVFALVVGSAVAYFMFQVGTAEGEALEVAAEAFSRIGGFPDAGDLVLQWLRTMTPLMVAVIAGWISARTAAVAQRGAPA